jgi:hypothetical protein
VEKQMPLDSAESGQPLLVVAVEGAGGAAPDLALLDAQWEDAPVTFGPEAAPNCKDGLIAKIRAGRRPAPGLAR